VKQDARTEFPVLTNSLNKIDFQWSFNDVVLPTTGTTKTVKYKHNQLEVDE